MKQTFLTEKGPKAVGPYSTAVIHGEVAYLSGMIPLDPETGKIVPGGIEAQAHRTFQNIQVVLGEMGLNTDNILKISLFLSDLSNFGAVNAIYAEYFGPNYPARSCFQVAALPLGAMIEAEVTAGMIR